MPARILLIDDDALTMDIVSAALTSKGHAVDTAESCLAALDLIKHNDYDLALIDYQMPDIDGLAAARLLQTLTAQTHVPRLVALTGNIDKLKGQAGADDVFYDVLEKPIAPAELARYVDRTIGETDYGRLANLARALWRERGFEQAPRAITVPQPSREQAMMLSLFFEPAEGGAADCIVLTKETGVDELERLRGLDGHYTLPIVDLSGKAGKLADVSLNAASPADWRNVADTVARFSGNRNRLEHRFLRSENLRDQLLAYLYVAGRTFSPILDASKPSCVTYPGCLPADAVQAAEALASQGFLTKRFADRFYTCGSCQSKRLSVREECPSCRSADVEMSEVIHHFRCAHQAPEREFRSGSHLICPKCRTALRHYGHDYDRPGQVLICHACGAWNSEPAVGFVCLDCGTHTDGEAIASQDVHSFELTAKARRVLTGDAMPATPDAPQQARPAAAHEGRTADGPAALPEQLLSELHALGLDTAVHDSGQIIEITYGGEIGLIERYGFPAFAKLRRLFRENLANLLSDYGRVVSGEESDFLILLEEEGDLPLFLSKAFARAQESLAEGLRPEFRVMEQEEVAVAP
ncbi:response regulator [Methyloligella sp. 2.7D]|uniref:TackOD1 domain-containing metal-binding protein n=1 Tax=unclassified Methyloligella TaxID=2625955 RepID=UPI00157C9021|nr:response regulator [Methyloligella sp. GL2]QKP77177.1 response regulator [Methyloligella sp. GL2]